MVLHEFSHLYLCDHRVHTTSKDKNTMQFIDLALQQKRIRSDLERHLLAVLDHGKYIMGPEIEQLETELAEFVGVQNAVSCASGTDALLIALMASGIGPGDIVFTTPFTFIATAEVVQLLGAIPVFVDIDPATFNIDATQLSRAIHAISKGNKRLHPLPHMVSAKNPMKAIIAVDLFGLPADYDSINPLAQDNGLVVIEDAAQSFGATYQGKRACSLAQIACTSFFPAKPLGCYGDGGMCFADDDRLASVMKSIRIHGKGTDKYDNVRIGLNGRLDTMQAAVLLSKMSVFPEEVALRRQVAGRYREFLSGIEGLILPGEPSGSQSVWAQYSIVAGNAGQREKLQTALKEKNIPTAVYYPKPLHLQTAFSQLGYRENDFPISERFAKTIFSLPMHPYLGADDQKIIADTIERCLKP
jgi:UDP-2-acetamido-2-deoxy-ribo-hexuluronate aminotransferase